MCLYNQIRYTGAQTLKKKEFPPQFLSGNGINRLENSCSGQFCYLNFIH